MSQAIGTILCPCCGAQPANSSMTCQACYAWVYLACGMKFCSAHQSRDRHDHWKSCEVCRGASDLD